MVGNPSRQKKDNSHSLRYHFHLPLGVQICIPELDIQIQNTIWNSICFGLGCLRDTLCWFEKLDHGLTTQLLIIITDLPTPNVACNVEEYF